MLRSFYLVPEHWVIVAHHDLREFEMSLLEFAKGIARESSVLLLEKWGAHRTVEIKQNQLDLVTDADRASEALLVSRIRERYPNHAILGEEGTGSLEDLSHAEGVWVLDPLDGTVNYAHHLPMFGVSIAFIQQGVIEVGVVAVPRMQELFWAQRGQGAWCNDKPIQVSACRTLLESVLATGFAYDKHESPRDNLENFSVLMKQVRGIRRMGAACIDLAYVACGRLDGFWEEKLNPWDIAAGALLVTEAGGQISGYDGASLVLTAGHLVCSNGLLQEPLRQALLPYAHKHHIVTTTENQP